MTLSGRNIISRDLADSIKQCLGRKVNLSLKVIVKAEIKSEKFEIRILGFSTCRLFVLTMKVPTRVDHHFHYLDIQAIESKSPNQLCLTIYDKNYTFYTSNEDPTSCQDVDAMILHLGTALKNLFPSVPFKHIIRKVDVVPQKRLQALEDLDRATVGGPQDVGPCGGFSDQYACMCDYHALPYRAEVAWDVDTIYLSHDTRELYLHDFDYLESKDLIPIISALEYNTWFVKLKATHSKLSHEVVERILHVISKSLCLEEIYLDNIGAKSEFANKLSLAIMSNSHIPLMTLDISHNPIEDKGLSNLRGVLAKVAPVIPGGAVHISNPIGRQAKGLSHLNLSHCNLTSKGVNMLAHSLSVNKYMCQTLTFLSLAGNSLKDDMNNLYNFLAQPNVLKTLDLSATECAIDAVFGALLRGCTTHLSNLDLSRNYFGSKKTKEMFPSFKQYFTSTIALTDLNLSHCKLPADALKNVLLGLACNENITEVKLDLSCNHLGSTGAQILESCIHGVRCLVSLDIAENGMENQLGSVVMAVSKNKSIKTLNIGRNLSNIKSKHVAQVMEAVVHLIQEDECVLQTLVFNDSRLKQDLHSLLNALGSNRCLQSLDISGNYMGDGGARLLAKALQINSKLQHICYDRNNITLLGYGDIAYALQSNYSMKFIPFPMHDTMLCMKTSPEKTESVMRSIQDCLFRNISPRNFSNGQAFRLQQGFILSSTQQQVDRLVLQTGEMARTLKRTTASASPSGEPPSGVSSMLRWSDALIKDAESSKQLISHFHDVLRRDGDSNPLETKLRQLSKELHSVFQSYIKDTVENMVRSAQERCPNVLNDEKVVDEIRSVCLAKSQVSSQFIDEVLVEQAGSVVLNKVNEVNLTIASTVSDRVVDEVVDSLSKTCKGLQTGEEPPRRRAMTAVEGDRERSVMDSNTCQGNRLSDTSSQSDNRSQKSEPSPMATPVLGSKRKNLHGRKLRPQSVVAAESLDSVSELPSNSGQLQHLGKARPRRAKTRAPTRPMGRAEVLEDDHDISQGVDTFFRPGSTTPTTPLVSPDTENGPRMVKSGSISSMDSFPPTTSAGKTASDRGSLESLTRTESPHESPRLKSKSEEEEEGEVEADAVESEEKRSVSSLIGKLGAETPLKLSPDVSNKRLSSHSFEDKHHREGDEGSAVPRKSAVGLQRFGARSSGIIGGGVGKELLLSEMKARQEKRSSMLVKDEESNKKEDVRKSSASSGGLLETVKLRSTGLSNALKSPVNGLPQSKLSSKTNSNESSSTESSSGAASKLKVLASCLKPKQPLPPPAFGPKPRPKSAFSPDCRPAHDERIKSGGENEAPTHRSVRALAASLLSKAGVSAQVGPSSPDETSKKSSSLPRNTVPVVEGKEPSNDCIDGSSNKLEDSTLPLSEAEAAARRSSVEGSLSNLIPSPFRRKSSHKHVLEPCDSSLEDAVDV